MKLQHFLVLILSLFVGHAQASVLWKVWETTYRIDTTFHAQIGPGTTQTSLLLSGPDTTLTLFYLTIDLTNPYIDIKAVCAKDRVAGTQTVTQMAQSHSIDGEKLYFAGINGGFFAMSGTANDGVTNIAGQPHHAIIVENEIYRTSTSSVCRHFGITSNLVPYISNASVNFTGTITSGTKTYEISGVNVNAANNKLMLYTDKMPGQVTQVTGSLFPLYYEIALLPKIGEKLIPGKKCKMIVSGSYTRGTNMAIPTGGYVISGKGLAAPFIQGLNNGDEVEIYLPLSFDGETVVAENMVTGNPKILGAGKVLDTESERSDAKEWHPRTSIGYSKDKKKLIMLVCDGRTSRSRGVRTKELADLMRYAGAQDAVNLDGGGSSTLYTSMLGVRNYPSSDGVQRAVGDGMFVVSTAPRNVFVSAIHFATPPHIISKGEEYTPTVYGYNTYGMLVNTDISNYTITCDDGLGQIKADGKTFVASGSGRGKIYARTPAGYSCEMEVYIKEDIRNIYFRLDSIISDCHYQYPIEICMTNSKNETVSISPKVLSWKSSDENIAIVENGTLKGLKNGKAEIYGTIAGLCDTLKVNVQEPAQPIININTGNEDWLKATFTTSAGFKNTTVSNSKESGTDISFLYNSTSAKTISLAANTRLFGLPDTLRVHIHPGETNINTFSCTLRLPSQKTITANMPIPQTNKKNTFDIPLSNTIGETFDIANYPITLSYLTIGTGTNTLGENYRINLPAIELIYNNYNENGSNINTNKCETLQYSIIDRTLYLETTADKIELYHISGKIMAATAHENKISIPEMGAYIVRIINGEKVISKKIVINQ